MDEINKKSLLLRLPDEIFDVMKEFKKKTGISYTNMLYNAIFWFFYTKGLIDWKKRTIVIEEKKEKNLLKEVPPDSIMYCDAGSCSVDPINKQSY